MSNSACSEFYLSSQLRLLITIKMDENQMDATAPETMEEGAEQATEETTEEAA